MAITADMKMLEDAIRDYIANGGDQKDIRLAHKVDTNGFRISVKNPANLDWTHYDLDRYEAYLNERSFKDLFRRQLAENMYDSVYAPNRAQTSTIPMQKTMPTKQISAMHTTGYNPKDDVGAPKNGADINLPKFPEHHVAAVIARATVAHTPENKRIAAYAVGMSLDLLMQFLREQDPTGELDEVKDFRYMLEQFAEWAGFENFDAWEK